MTDITMCVDDVLCPKAGSCKRSRQNTNPNEFQSWSSFAPKNKMIDMCDFYYPVYEQKVSGSTGSMGKLAQYTDGSYSREWVEE